MNQADAIRAYVLAVANGNPDEVAEADKVLHEAFPKGLPKRSTYSGSKLRWWRRELAHSRIELAASTNIDERTLGKIERGEVHFGPVRAERCAKALGIAVELLAD